VDGPIGAGSTTLKSDVIPAAAFDVARRDAADFIRRNHRLPNEVFLGAETLSLKDFTATLASAVLQPNAPIRVVHGTIGFDSYFSTDPHKSFDWIIHPAGFAAPELLDLGRLQGWTLKPAVLRAGV